MQAHMRLILLTILGTICVNPPVYGQGTTDIEAYVQHQELSVSNYKVVPLLVEAVDSNNFGLTRDAVKTHAELRVRSVGLKPVDAAGSSEHYLYVQIHVAGLAFNINMDFKRSAQWTMADGQKADGFAAVWRQGNITGTHGQNAKYVLDALDQLLDHFLNAYLKANQDDK